MGDLISGVAAEATIEARAERGGEQQEGLVSLCVHNLPTRGPRQLSDSESVLACLRRAEMDAGQQSAWPWKWRHAPDRSCWTAASARCPSSRAPAIEKPCSPFVACHRAQQGEQGQLSAAWVRPVRAWGKVAAANGSSSPASTASTAAALPPMHTAATPAQAASSASAVQVSKRQPPNAVAATDETAVTDGCVAAEPCLCARATPAAGECLASAACALQSRPPGAGSRAGSTKQQRPASASFSRA